MNANSQTQPSNGQPQGHGAVWYELRYEREEVCEALLQERTGADFPVDKETLQTRLTLIDEALDRLMAGTYGDCVQCGRWIEDTKLHIDPAMPYCVACQSEHKRVPFVRAYIPTLRYRSPIAVP
ncbi:MAG TPA: TraR/DksA C4-type zinc finger protein [Pyrinomonadaceae bacterium]|nr:TraR/DksA C4-type zinc finger protein [Pyrinomonadaceae bacterium]